MSKIKSIFSAIYNNMWRNPKGRLTTRLKGACESIPPKQRLTVVSLMLTVFVLTAFFVFGHACYRIGLGHSRQAVEVKHIRSLELPSTSNDVQPLTPSVYDNAGMESED